MNSSNVFCVIMAGGIGSRFWPLSRTKKPKQFLDILGTGSSLIQQTYKRLTGICPSENIYIVTGKIYRDLVIEQLPEVNPQNILLEPMRRNTAPCIAYANHVIKQRNPDAIVIVAPSDHLILEPDNFLSTIRTSINFAENNNALLTIGIKPSRPETGYGYIQISENAEESTKDMFKVKTFTEKPNLELAKVFVDSGEFYWNAGIFIWSAKAIYEAFGKYLPKMQALFDENLTPIEASDHQESLSNIYAECKNVSIDYGILEKADNVYVICSEFGWSDLGTWGSLYQNHPKNQDGNAIWGNNVLTYNVSNSIINVPNNKLVIVQGLQNYIVTESDNVLLICSRDNEQDIKQFQNDALLEKGEEFI